MVSSQLLVECKLVRNLLIFWSYSLPGTALLNLKYMRLITAVISLRWEDGNPKSTAPGDSLVHKCRVLAECTSIF